MVKRILVLCLCLLSVLSMGGVLATWVYCIAPPAPTGSSMTLALSPFEYAPDEVLPGGGSSTGEVQLGENHFKLVDLVLNEDSKGYGLNINNNVLLHRYLRNDGYVYSNQKVSGGNLKHILDPSQNTHKMYYCLKRISDTEYHCYTFSTDELEAAGGTEAEITAYRTVLIKTDIWRATTSYKGSALTMKLSDFGLSADPNAIPYSINIDSWHVKHH